MSCANVFTGRDALLRHKEAGPLAKRLVMFKRKDPEPVLFGEEVIWMDGRIAGYVSSGAYGFTLGASVGMGYVRHPDEVTGALADSASWEIEIACERYPAEASLALASMVVRSPTRSSLDRWIGGAGSRGKSSCRNVAG